MLTRLALVASLAFLLAPASSRAVCVQNPATNCFINGDFEAGSLVGWTFSASCALGNGTAIDPCAGVITPGTTTGCTASVGSCCIGWTFCGPGIPAVSCGGYAMMIFSGEPPTCPAPAWGQLEQTVTVPFGGAMLDFDYAYDDDNLCGATGNIWIEVSGGSCGSTTVWMTTLTVNTPWSHHTENMSAYGGCQVTLRARANAPGAPCSFTFLDEVEMSCLPPVSPTPTPTRTPTVTPTPSYYVEYRMEIAAENGEVVRKIHQIGPIPIASPTFASLVVDPQHFTFPTASGASFVRIQYRDAFANWDGYTDDGAPVESGTYFCRAWTFNPFGVISEDVAPIFVYRHDWPARLRIYDPGGELIAERTGVHTVSGAQSFRMDPNPFSAGDANPLASFSAVRLDTGTLGIAAPGGLLGWDGMVDRTATPSVAENGTYHAVLGLDLPSGRRLELSTPLTVLTRNRAVVKGMSIFPNPAAVGSGPVSIVADAPDADSLRLRVYDLSGLLVVERTATGDARVRAAGVRAYAEAPAGTRLVWDPAPSVRSGVYVVEVRGWTRDGRSQALRRKLALIR